MQIQLSYYSSQGHRELNEDSISVLEFGSSVLAVVADGLGGHGRGDEASGCLVSSVSSALQNQPVSETALCNALRQANEKVLAMQKDGANMQTTAAALWIGKNRAITANIGDSRLYQIRGGKIVFQSVDHSAAQMAVLVGDITPEQIRGYQGRNQLVRAIGMSHDIRIDSNILDVCAGDRFLICTDGFWENITEQEMLYYLEHAADTRDWLKQMREYVEARGNTEMDNHSAIVIGLVSKQMGQA